MQNFLLAVDRLSTWIGKIFAWTALILTITISWEVFSRYVLNKPHAWMLDFQIMLYGTPVHDRRRLHPGQERPCPR